MDAGLYFSNNCLKLLSIIHVETFDPFDILDIDRVTISN